jgi:hypothetical protein
MVQFAENEKNYKKLLHIYSIGGTIASSKTYATFAPHIEIGGFLQWIRRTLKK